MKTVAPFFNYDEVVKALDKQGAFLTVESREGKLNTMTIGWALLGVMWDKPMIMVAVRPSRYTFGLLENAEDFTVTFPFSDMHKQLIFCGTQSGSVIDKIKDCGLTTLPSQNVKSPIIDIKDSRNYECRIVQKSAMDKSSLDIKYDQRLYQDKSYHTYYFGEIIACYEM